jgi:hypothetical protein
LLSLPFQDTFPARRVVISPLYLRNQSLGFRFVARWIVLQIIEQLTFIEEVTGHHCEYQTAVVSDFLAGFQSLHEVLHHGIAV